MGDAAATVMRIYSSHDRGDLAGLQGVLHPDVVWESAEGYPYAAHDGPWRGREDAMREVVEAINRQWDGFTTRIDEVIEMPNRVIIIGRYRGRFRSTRRDVDAQVCAIYTVENGLVTRFQQFTDTAQFRTAMGLSP